MIYRKGREGRNGFLVNPEPLTSSLAKGKVNPTAARNVE